jgi:hypothetical protein
MKRREFLNLGGATVVAGSMMALPAEAASLRLPSMDEVFARFDAMIEATRASFARSRTIDDQPVLRTGMDGLWAALVAYSAFLELPLVQQVHPGMQKRIRAVAADLSRATDSFVATVAADDPALWERMERGRAGLPETQAILDGFDAEARRLGVGNTARRRFHGLLRRSIHELRTRDVRESTSEFVDVATRTDAPQFDADVRTVQEVSEARDAWAATGVRYDEEEGDEGTVQHTRSGARTLGLVFIIVGGSITFIGIAIAIVGYQCFCIGAFIALIGLGFLIPGIIIHSNAVRKENQAAAP